MEGVERGRFGSSAEAISPNGDVDNSEAGDGRKVILADTDHLCGVCGNETSPWRAFTRGLNPMFMDIDDGTGVGKRDSEPNDPRWEQARRALGATRALAERLDLKRMHPRADLCSTGFCLADASPQGAYVSFLPVGGSVTVDASATPGMLRVARIDLATGFALSHATVRGGARVTLGTGGEAPALLLLSSSRG